MMDGLLIKTQNQKNVNLYRIFVSHILTLFFSLFASKSAESKAFYVHISVFFSRQTTLKVRHDEYE